MNRKLTGRSPKIKKTTMFEWEISSPLKLIHIDIHAISLMNI